MQQRLAERKRSKVMRATSQINNQTLPLNFGNAEKLTVGANDISIASVHIPVITTSAINMNTHAESSPIRPQQNIVKIAKVRDDDTFSQGNRSTTTQGGGLANRIGQAVSRILSQTVNVDCTDDDEVNDLVNLLNELNAHHDLTIKLSNQSKILKFLNEVTDSNQFSASKATPTIKDYKVTIGTVKSEFGKLGFQSKMRLEMKQLMIDPKVKEIVD